MEEAPSGEHPMKRSKKAKAGPKFSYYDLIFSAIVEAKYTCGGMSYSQANSFARKRMAEIAAESGQRQRKGKP